MLGLYHERVGVGGLLGHPEPPRAASAGHVSGRDLPAVLPRPQITSTWNVFQMKKMTPVLNTASPLYFLSLAGSVSFSENAPSLPSFFLLCQENSLLSFKT